MDVPRVRVGDNAAYLAAHPTARRILGQLISDQAPALFAAPVDTGRPVPGWDNPRGARFRAELIARGMITHRRAGRFQELHVTDAGEAAYAAVWHHPPRVGV